MSIDLLSLGLAATMPLLVFAAYALVRSLVEATARRPTRRRRAGRSRSSDRGDAFAAATVRPPPAPDPAHGVLAKLATTRPAVESPSLRGPSVPAALPETNGNVRVPRSFSPTMPRLEERRSNLTGRLYHAHPATPSANGASDATSPGDRQRPLVGEPGAAASAAVSRLGHALMTSTLKPIRTILGRREPDPGPIEPHWPEPEPEPAVASFRLFDFVEDAGGPCPVCDESRDRGAQFCRRCGRALYERSSGAAVPVWSSAVTLPTAPFPPFEARSTPPHADPPVAGPPYSRPVTASPPVVRPARYVPAAVPAAAETPTPRATPPPSSIGGAVASAAVEAPGPAVARKAGKRAVIKEGAVKEGEVKDAVAKDVVAKDKDAVAKDAVAKAARQGSAAERAMRSRVPDARPEVDTGGATRETVDLNRATADQLSALRGVGEKTAQRIIAAREERPFATVEALTERKIIGSLALEKLRDQVTVRRRRR